MEMAEDVRTLRLSPLSPGENVGVKSARLSLETQVHVAMANHTLSPLNSQGCCEDKGGGEG